MTKHYLLIQQKAPYVSYQGQELLDLALATNAFSQQATILFQGDGILQLLPDQQSHMVGRKNFTKAYEALTLYEIPCYIVEEDLTSLNLDMKQLIIQPILINQEQLQQFIQTFHVVIK